MFLNNLNRIAISFLLVLGFCSQVRAGSVAALDIMTIYQEYSLVQEANEKVNELETGFKRIIATADTELKELEKKGKETDLLKKREEIQNIVDDKVEDLHDLKELYNTTINRNVHNTLASFAKTKGYSLILDKHYVITEIPDITKDFLISLEKNSKSLKN